MKNENSLVMVIRIEMPNVHGQTLTCREYHKSSQKKREEPFKKFTHLLTKTHRTKRMILHQKQNFLRNQAQHAVLKEHVNHTLLLSSSLKTLGGLPVAG